MNATPRVTRTDRHAMSSVRLTTEQKQSIRRATDRACRTVGAAWQQILLFGSRVNPEQTGGDIDLLIELAATPPADTYRLTQQLRLALEDELGERKIDLVLDDGHTTSPFCKLAREHAVVLHSNT
jgi:predicted nucleotidyltransferase